MKARKKTSEKNAAKDYNGEFPEIPSYRASMEDLKKFEELIAKNFDSFTKYGAMKIIPPAEWKPVNENFDFVKDTSEKFPVKSFDVLNAGEPGLFYIYVSNRKRAGNMTILEYYKKVKKIEKKFEHLNLDEKEKLILDGTINKVLYATDVDFPVLNKSYDPLNLNHIPNLLDKYTEQFGHLDGITTPLSYIGAMGSRFGWHVEDMNLFSISVMLFGEPKIWYLIPPNQGQELENLQERHKQWPCIQCSHPLRHKNNVFCPHFLRSCGINVYKTVHNAMEIVVTGPGSYHSGMNLGYNFAVAVNFAYEQWIPFGEKFSKCGCESLSDSFSCKIEEIIGVDKYSIGASKQAIAGKKTAVSLPFKKRFKAFNCEKCAKLFKTISSLNYHKKTFHSDKKYKCNTCKPVKSFKYLKNLEAHLNESHQRASSAAERKPIRPLEKKPERKPFACGKCSSKFSANWELTNHIKLVHGSTVFKCAHCSFKCNYKKNLGRHIKNKHN